MVFRIPYWTGRNPMLRDALYYLNDEISRIERVRTRIDPTSIKHIRRHGILRRGTILRDLLDGKADLKTTIGRLYELTAELIVLYNQSENSDNV